MPDIVAITAALDGLKAATEIVRRYRVKSLLSNSVFKPSLLC
jgi:hypothetical protein